jgi:hypothetical protein
VGRASNRKKARRQEALRQAARRRRRATQGATAQQVTPALAAALEAIDQLFSARAERQVPEYRAWCDGQPVPAEVPRWAENSLGRRLCSGPYLAQAQNAPCLVTVTVPDRMVIITQSAQWRMAATVIVRAVVFDGVQVDHPAVSSLLGMLAPIAKEELEYGQDLEDWYRSGRDEEKPEFPEDDAPVFLIGTCALGEATEAVVGEDPLDEVIAALSPALNGIIPGLDGRAVADVLTGGRATPYVCDLPDYVLKRMRHSFSAGGALLELADSRAVPPGDILRVGLTILSRIAELCKSDSPSIIRKAA